MFIQDIKLLKTADKIKITLQTKNTAEKQSVKCLSYNYNILTNLLSQRYFLLYSFS